MYFHILRMCTFKATCVCVYSVYKHGSVDKIGIIEIDINRHN